MKESDLKSEIYLCKPHDFSLPCGYNCVFGAAPSFEELVIQTDEMIF